MPGACMLSSTSTQKSAGRLAERVPEGVRKECQSDEVLICRVRVVVRWCWLVARVDGRAERSWGGAWPDRARTRARPTFGRVGAESGLGRSRTDSVFTVNKM